MSQNSRNLNKPWPTSHPWQVNIYYFPNICYIVRQGGKPMKDLLLIAGVVAVWYVFNRYILPKMGIQT